jgi:hypothetical protein
MTSPAYGLTMPVRAGTDPGMVCSHKKLQKAYQTVVSSMSVRMHQTTSARLPKNTKHSKTTVVDLGNQTPGLGLCGSILAETKGIVKVEWDGVGKVALELGEFSRLSSCSGTTKIQLDEYHPQTKFRLDTLPVTATYPWCSEAPRCHTTQNTTPRTQ